VPGRQRRASYRGASMGIIARRGLVLAGLVVSACSAPAPLHGVLDSPGPAPDRAQEMRLYAFMIGHWDTRIVAYAEDGKRHESRGEVHAGWALEGRAIQDVWLTPPRAERRPGAPLPELPVTGAWYGTTLRVYDPSLGAWHILWSDPATQFYARQLG